MGIRHTVVAVLICHAKHLGCLRRNFLLAFLASVSGISQVYAQQPLSLWSMENNANDVVGVNYGILGAGASFVTGTQKVGNYALSLDGEDDYVNLRPQVHNFPLGSSARSVAGWFNTDNSDGQKPSFFGYGGRDYPGTKGQRFSIRADRKAVLVDFNGHRWGVDRLRLKPGWRHVAVTYPEGGNSASPSIYLDGVLQNSRTITGSVIPVNTVANFSVYAAIGRSVDGDYFGGKIDEVSLYDFELSQSQVEDLYNGADLPITYSVFSPDASLKVAVTSNNGNLSYAVFRNNVEDLTFYARWERVRRKGIEILRESNNGDHILLDNGDVFGTQGDDLNGNLIYSGIRSSVEIISDSPVSIKDSTAHTVTSASKSKHDATWTPTWGQFSSIRDYHEQLTLELDVGDTSFALTFKVFNDGLGFRFTADDQTTLTGDILKYKVRYNMAAEQFMGHWPRGEYSPAGPIAIESLGTNPRTPLVVAFTNTLLLDESSSTDTEPEETSGYFALLESDLYSAEAFRAIVFQRVGGQPAVTSNVTSAPIPVGDFVSPWRVILVGDTPGDLLESTVPVNLAAPLELADASWVRPGKGLFNWRTLGYRTDDGSFTYAINTATLKRLIDFASANRLEYVQVDDNWYIQINNGRLVSQANNFDIEEIISYANDNDVSIVIYVDRSPASRVRRTSDEQLYRLFDELGGAAIKYGFRGNDAPFTREALRSTAAKQMLINFHDNPVPLTGARRTIPNAITRQTGWGQQDARRAFAPTDFLEMAMINALLGPFDQINGIYDINEMPNRSKGSNNPINSTVAGENARVLIMFSGMILLPDVPEEYDKKADMFEFLREMPATWDETKILHSSLPNYITTARRSGEEWFVCSATNENARTLSIPLGFLNGDANYDVTYYEDDHDGRNPTHYINNRETYQVRTGTVVSTDTASAVMVAGGGHCMWIRPQ